MLSITIGTVLGVVVIAMVAVLVFYIVKARKWHRSTFQSLDGNEEAWPVYDTLRPKEHTYRQDRGTSVVTSPGIHKQHAYDVQRVNVISKAMEKFHNIVSVCVRACVGACRYVVSFIYYKLTTAHTFVYLFVWLVVCLTVCLILKRKVEDNGIFLRWDYSHIFMCYIP